MTFAALMEAVEQRPVVCTPEAAYYAALPLVARIDAELTRGIKHYRALDGQLLTTLDQVVNAIIAGELEI